MQYIENSHNSITEKQKKIDKGLIDISQKKTYECPTSNLKDA